MPLEGRQGGQAHPEFGTLVNPITTREADYSHLDLKTQRHLCVVKIKAIMKNHLFANDNKKSVSRYYASCIWIYLMISYTPFVSLNIIQECCRVNRLTHGLLYIWTELLSIFLLIFPHEAGTWDPNYTPGVDLFWPRTTTRRVVFIYTVFPRIVSALV